MALVLELLAGEAEAAAQAAEAGRTKGLMSDVYYEIARRAGEMEGVVGDVGNAGDDGIVSRAAMLRCVRDVIKEATLRALSASKPAEEGVEKGEGVEEGEGRAAPTPPHPHSSFHLSESLMQPFNRISGKVASSTAF